MSFSSLCVTRSLHQYCMCAWSRQRRVSDPEDRTEVAVCISKTLDGDSNEFQSESRELKTGE